MSQKRVTETPDLDKLLALAEEATAGDWYSEVWATRIFGPEDGPYIAACDPTTIKALVEEVRSLRRDLDAALHLCKLAEADALERERALVEELRQWRSGERSPAYPEG